MLAQLEFRLLLQAGVGLDSMSNSRAHDARISGISVKFHILITDSVFTLSVMVVKSKFEYECNNLLCS